LRDYAAKRKKMVLDYASMTNKMNVRQDFIEKGYRKTGDLGEVAAYAGLLLHKETD